MADRKPLKVLPDGGGDSTGLGEFVDADTIGVVDGGTGLAAVGNNQLLTGHSSSTTGALTSQSNLTFDGSKLTVGAAGATVSSSADGLVVNDGANAGMTIYSTGTSSGQMKLSLTNAEGADAGAAIIYNNADDDLFFNVNGATERARILGTGGITFNGDTNDSNALDDYEEGTFTPELGAHSSNGTHSYTTQVGRYTKIGNVVHIWLNLEINTLNTSGTISGNLEIRGLPYTSDNVSGQMYMGTFLPSGLVVSGVGPVVMMGINETKLSMAEANNNTGYSMFTSSDVASGDRFYIQVSYHTA